MSELKKVRSGDPLRIPADDYNAAMDAARFVANRQHDVASGLREGSRQPCIVTVRNDSGEDRARFDVLGIDSPIVLPEANATEFANRIALAGVTPTAGHAGRFVILLEPLAAGKVGQAVAAGVCQVRINVANDNDGFADVADSDATELASGTSGAATILWKESGTGENNWAIIRFGGGSASESAGSDDGCIYAKLGEATDVGPSQRSYKWDQVEKTGAGHAGWTIQETTSSIAFEDGGGNPVNPAEDETITVGSFVFQFIKTHPATGDNIGVYIYDDAAATMNGDAGLVYAIGAHGLINVRRTTPPSHKCLFDPSDGWPVSTTGANIVITVKAGAHNSENDGEAYDLAEIPGDTNLPVPAGSIVKMCPVRIVGGGVEYWFDRRYVYDCCSGCGCPDADDMPNEITATIAELLVAASDCLGGHTGYPGCPDSVPPCPPSDDYRVWSFGGWEVPSGPVTLTKTGPCTWSGSATAHVNEYENEDCTGFLHQWDATFYVTVQCFNGRWACGISINVTNFGGFAGGFWDIAGYSENLQGHVFHNQYNTDAWVIYGGTVTISWSEP